MTWYYIYQYLNISLPKAMDIIEDFSEISGKTMNNEKNWIDINS